MLIVINRDHYVTFWYSRMHCSIPFIRNKIVLKINMDKYIVKGNVEVYNHTEPQQTRPTVLDKFRTHSQIRDLDNLFSCYQNNVGDEWQNSLVTRFVNSHFILILSLKFESSHQYHCRQNKWCSMMKVRSLFKVSFTQNWGNTGRLW